MSALRSATRFINAPVSPSTLRGSSPLALKAVNMALAPRHDDHHGPTAGARVGTPRPFALKFGRGSARIGVNGQSLRDPVPMPRVEREGGDGGSASKEGGRSRGGQGIEPLKGGRAVGSPQLGRLGKVVQLPAPARQRHAPARRLLWTRSGRHLTWSGSGFGCRAGAGSDQGGRGRRGLHKQQGVQSQSPARARPLANLALPRRPPRLVPVPCRTRALPHALPRRR